ncbi:hypothetical protein ACIBSV_32045 [Embleya sp. NPDC050154]
MTLLAPSCGGAAHVELIRRLGTATVRVTLTARRCRRACSRHRA